MIFNKICATPIILQKIEPWSLPFNFSLHSIPHQNHFLTRMFESISSSMVIMRHLSPNSPLNTPLKVNTIQGVGFRLVSFHNFDISFNDKSVTYSPLSPPKNSINMITTMSSAILLFSSKPCIFHYYSTMSNKSCSSLKGSPKFLYIITHILILFYHMNCSNNSTCIRLLEIIIFLYLLAKLAPSSTPTSDPHIFPKSHAYCRVISHCRQSGYLPRLSYFLSARTSAFMPMLSCNGISINGGNGL